MEYNFRSIEKKWQAHWRSSGVYQVSNKSTRPKYYVLDMFPYPSGAGLHVGHPLGYIASDIFSRYKRLQGFNVLHPMGYDAFGLPAEQYAIEHGVHPASSTKKNIDTLLKYEALLTQCCYLSRMAYSPADIFCRMTQHLDVTPNAFNNYIRAIEKIYDNLFNYKCSFDSKYIQEHPEFSKYFNHIK